MSSVLERKLVVVSGKGGVGKTTVAAALGLVGARRGLRTIVVEVTGGAAGDIATGAGRLAALLGHPEPPAHGVETPLRDGLWALSIDRDRVLTEWLRAIGGRVPARVLTSSSSFQYLIAAAPGAREMIAMVKLWELAESRRPSARDRSSDRASPDGDARPSTRDYDLVVFDAPATGHALAMLRSPHTFGTIARVGPIARQAGQVRALLDDPARSAYLAVTHATEMGVTETLELRASLRRELGRELDAAIVNGALPLRFEHGELGRILALAGERPASARTPAARTPTAGGRAQGAGAAGTPAAEAPMDQAPVDSTPVGAAVRAAQTIHRRARTQQRQIARLRRDSGGHAAIPVVRVPFMFRAELGLDALELIAGRLDRAL